MKYQVPRLALATNCRVYLPCERGLWKHTSLFPEPVSGRRLQAAPPEAAHCEAQAQLPDAAGDVGQETVWRTEREA